MRNCLVTKLKEVVNNDNLKKIGVLYLKAQYNSAITEQTTDENRVRMQGLEIQLHVDTVNNVASEATVTVNGSGYFSKSLSDIKAGTGVQSMVISGSESVVTLYFANGDYDIEITNKYDIERIATKATGSQSSVISVPLEDLSYLTKLKYLRVYGSRSYSNSIECLSNLSGITYLYLNKLVLSGNVSAIANNQDMTTLNLYGTNVSGDISSLGKLVDLTSMSFGDTNVSGAIEDFVAQQSENGRTTLSTPMNADQILTYATLGGKHYADVKCNLGWESASKIFVYTGNADYTLCTTVYCKGYTQSEAETKWPGKTIIRVDA